MLDMNQQELADATGYTRQYISRVERGHTSPSVPVLVRFAEVLETTPNDLIGPEWINDD